MNTEPKQSDTALVPRQQAGALALLSGGRAETAKALVAAINACHPVQKEGRVSYGKTNYGYATADAIIEEGRKALSSAGLALIPVEASLNGSEREGPDRFELVRTFALIHSGSGEVTPLRVCWPVVPDTGRPLDKATAIADTLSLSYLLRDLLLMNRVDPSDDMNTRDDRQPAKQQSSFAKQKRPPADGAELLARLQKRETQLIAEKRCSAGDLLKHIVQQGVMLGHPADIAQWGPAPIGLAADWVRTFLALHSTPPPNGTPPASAPAAAPATSAEKAKELQVLMATKGRSWARKEKGDDD